MKWFPILKGLSLEKTCIPKILWTQPGDDFHGLLSGTFKSGWNGRYCRCILYGNGYAVCVWHGSENKQNFRNLWHDCRIGVDDDLFEYLFIYQKSKEEERKQKQLLLEAAEKADAANQAKSTFLLNMSMISEHR